MSDVVVPEQREGLVWELAAASTAMIVFALLVHRGLPGQAIGWLALLGAAALIGRSLRDVSEPRVVLGLGRPQARVIPIAVAGIGLGVLAGTLHQSESGALAGTAPGIQPFVVVACLIGATEELVYRGWLQGRAAVFGWPASVLIAALAHSAYKTALFVWPPDSVPLAYSLVGIGLWTFAGGIVLGLLRVSSRSVLPPLLAHVAFDAVVYASFPQAPWWVWG